MFGEFKFRRWDVLCARWFDVGLGWWVRRPDVVGGGEGFGFGRWLFNNFALPYCADDFHYADCFVFGGEEAAFWFGGCGEGERVLCWESVWLELADEQHTGEGGQR